MVRGILLRREPPSLPPASLLDTVLAPPYVTSSHIVDSSERFKRSRARGTVNTVLDDEYPFHCWSTVNSSLSARFSPFVIPAQTPRLEQYKEDIPD